MDTATQGLPPTLSVRQAAQFLMCSDKTIRRAIIRREIGAVRLCGGRGFIRIPRAEIERLLAEARVRS